MFSSEFANVSDDNYIHEFQVELRSPNAVIPKKAFDTDSGFDVVAIEHIKTLDNGVEMYDTYIGVKPPEGYYFELVPRSSISKSGYMLANSVGIIDSSYTGNIMIALRKMREDATLELPARICQIIPRKIEKMTPVVVERLSETERGAGGFGSTGNITM